MLRFALRSIIVVPLVSLAFSAPLLPADGWPAASATELARVMAEGKLTSEQLTAGCLDRIRQCEPEVHAILALNPDALAEARTLDAERQRTGPRSPLHGLPVLVKDNIDTSEMPTSLGFFGLKNSRPAKDADVIARLRAAGAIILAKTNLSELTSGPTQSSLGGQTRNPRNLDYGAAGSSSGTAAGLAAGYAPLGLGTDTTGSIRWPAATTGTVGLRPTFGLVNTTGTLAANPSLDVVGPMARSVGDVALLFAALQASVPTEQTKAHALTGARLGFFRADLTGNDPVVDAVIMAAVDRLRAAGATVAEIELPLALAQLNTMTDVIYRTESRPNIDDYLRRLGPGLPHSLSDILALSEQVTGPSTECPFPNPGRLSGYRLQLAAWTSDDPVYQAVRGPGRDYLRALLSGLLARDHLDALLYPTSNQRINAIGSPARRGLKGYFGNAGCGLAALAGWPELSMPVGATPEGLPVGLSFLGPANSDRRLLDLGADCETATKR